MQAADLRDGDDAPDPALAGSGRVRAILVECEMRPRSAMVFDVVRKDTTQMALVEDYDVVEAVATDRTVHALDVRVLPRRVGRRDDFRDSHRFDPAAEVPAIRGIAIAKQIARSSVPRERLGYLTR